jgi:cytochrome P450
MISDLLSENLQTIYGSFLVVGISTALFYFIIYPLYFHPLSKIPGPKICAITKYYILFKSWNEQRNRYVQSLHEKYGSIVRIGPNEIDINDSSYLKDIYIGNFDKSSFYSQFVNYGQPNTFSITTKKEHIASRKVSHKFYSKSNICSENIMSKVEKVMHDTLSAFDKYQNKSINVFVLFCDMAMDSVTSFAFGNGNYESLLADPFGDGEKVVVDFGLQSSTWFWVTQMPMFYDIVASKKVINASKRCYDWIERQFNNALQNIDKTIEKQEDTLLTVYFDSDSTTKKPIQKTELFNVIRTKSEFFDHIAAGHVTTGTTMSYLFYELAKNPTIQSKLQTELLNKLNNGKPISTTDYTPMKYNLVDNDEFLPYSHAVILETFRVHAAIPGQEPRIVPPKGLIWHGDAKTPACKIPEGTTVVMQPWSLHRVSNLFPNPNKFDPQRWLDASGDQLKAMKGNLLHFSSGARMCIGLNLATAEIKMILTSLLCRYNVELVDDFNYEYDGEKLDIYTTLPRTEKMMLKFKAIKS